MDIDNMTKKSKYQNQNDALCKIIELNYQKTEQTLNQEHLFSIHKQNHLCLVLQKFVSAVLGSVSPVNVNKVE